MTATITASVGRGATNEDADVQTVRRLLRRHGLWLIPLAPVAESGPADELLSLQIERFQFRACSYQAAGVAADADTGGWTADGRVDPGGFTLRRLNMMVIPQLRNVVFTSKTFTPTQTELTLANFQAAATTLGCEVAAIRAVAEVEAQRGPFQDSDNRPTILYERHIFRNRTASAYNRSHPALSGPQGNYGRYAAQYGKLRRAAVLDEDAALQSASWGQFQIMGFNHVAAGYADVQAYVTAMTESVANHLDAFVSFINANVALRTAIVNRNWANFARNYNGPGYAQNNYDTRMAAAYLRYSNAGTGQ